MSEAAREFERGQRALAEGNRSDALSGFLIALALDPDVRAHRVKALDTLGTTDGYASLPEAVLNGLERCVDDPDLDLQPLALVVRTLLDGNPMRSVWLAIATEADFETAEGAIADGALDSFLTDPLIRAVLTHAINISLDLEDILTGLRRHALEAAAQRQTSVLISRHRTFFEALAVQAERTDFAWVETDEETLWLNDTDGETDNLLICSAYRPEESFETETPSYPELTKIQDAVSLEVQNQYRSFPYPRWERVPKPESQSLANLMRARFPDETWPDRFAGPVSGLSAGCGTGRGASMLALSVQDLSLTAIDLSPTSLMFARAKADELGLESITFGLGDILELDDLKQRFDIVECSGVLHHMHDPLAGLKVLRRRVKPDGILRLALYSERARTAVVAARAWIREEGIADTANGVRQARAKLRTLAEDHPAKPVVNTPEFFVLSGLHDLIFNVQEHRFTPKQLKALLKKGGFRLLGFDHVNSMTAAQYKAAFPNDATQTDLDNWDTFEQNHPNAFTEMYQMWCRPVSGKP